MEDWFPDSELVHACHWSGKQQPSDSCKVQFLCFSSPAFSCCALLLYHRMLKNTRQLLMSEVWESGQLFFIVIYGYFLSIFFSWNHLAASCCYLPLVLLVTYCQQVSCSINQHYLKEKRSRDLLVVLCSTQRHFVCHKNPEWRFQLQGV